MVLSTLQGRAVICVESGLPVEIKFIQNNYTSQSFYLKKKKCPGQENQRLLKCIVDKCFKSLLNSKQHRSLVGIYPNKPSNTISDHLFTTQFCKFSLYLIKVLNVYKNIWPKERICKTQMLIGDQSVYLSLFYGYYFGLPGDQWLVGFSFCSCLFVVLLHDLC